MGRPRKLPAIEILEGMPGKLFIEDSGIDALGEPCVPEHLMDDARGCLEVVRRSMPPKVYSALDTFILAAFAMAWAIHKRAALEISNPDFKYVVTSLRGKPTVNAWLTILNTQASQIVTLGDRLGLDPKSRAGLKLPRANQQRSKFSGLIDRPMS